MNNGLGQQTGVACAEIGRSPFVQNPRWIGSNPEPGATKLPEFPLDLGKSINDAQRRNAARSNLTVLATQLVEAVTVSKEFLTPADKREFGGLLKDIVNLIGE